MALTLEIITPEKKVYSDTVDHVVLPTTEGDIDVLPQHIPLMSIIKPGELQVFKEGQVEFLAVDSGFIRILGDTVSVLTLDAIDIKDVDLSSIQEAETRAKAVLEDARRKKDIDLDELQKLEATARFAIVQKLIKSRRN